MRNSKPPNALDFKGFYLNAMCPRIILRNESVMVEDVVTQSFDAIPARILCGFQRSRF
jgi:hypothetical protein